MISRPDPPGELPEPAPDAARALRDRLREEIGPRLFETWFRDTPCRLRPPATFILTARNRFRKAWITREFGDHLRRIARELKGPEARFVVEVDVEVGGANAPLPGDLSRRDAHPGERDPSDGRQPPGPSLSLTHPRFTFETFIEGTCCRVAHAAALAVAERPGFSYNPLLLHGPAGTGKTHLIQAIYHQLATATSLRALYVTSEAFTNEFVRAAQVREMTDFRRRYRAADALLVDDLQFLSGKPKTQEEFLATCHHLLSRKRQVVVASLRPPAELEGFQEKTIALLRSSLVARLDPPDLVTRMTALVKKAHARGVDLSGEAAEYLARRVPGTIRELEGALTRALHLSRLQRAPLNAETIRSTLDELGEDQSRPSQAVSVDGILSAVEGYYGIKEKDLLSSSKVRTLVFARQVGMYLARELTPLSLQQIGLRFGGRDHSTVVYAQSCISRQLDRNPRLQADLEILRTRITEPAAH